MGRPLAVREVPKRHVVEVRLIRLRPPLANSCLELGLVVDVVNDLLIRPVAVQWLIEEFDSSLSKNGERVPLIGAEEILRSDSAWV